MNIFIILTALLLPHLASAQTSTDCEHMEAWDYSMAMCMPRAMAGMPMKMWMIHGNAFGVQTAQEGKRGTNALVSTNMVMFDYGQSAGDRHYLNVDLMATAELWTLPKDGYPLLLQIGEENHDGDAYLDAQHPHSSPIMGLTFSDTISLGPQKDYLKLFFAPRGEATEGPIAFMHRPTGVVNPDAPLGHHIGQDVGHITSTVLGGSLRLGHFTLEASAFNGREPEPAEVDLPMGELNSYATRLIVELPKDIQVMGSFARAKEPEGHGDGPDHVNRSSASAYSTLELGHDWLAQMALIYGQVEHYDDASILHSYAYEFLLDKEVNAYWGRVEVLERTAAELQIASTDPLDPRWITAVTLGYTRKISEHDTYDLSVGTSITKDFLPTEYEAAYSGDPLSGKVFLQVGGMIMKDL